MTPSTRNVGRVAGALVRKHGSLADQSGLVAGVEGAEPHCKKTCGARRDSAVVRGACLRSSFSDHDMLNDPKGA